VHDGLGVVYAVHAVQMGRGSTSMQWIHAWVKKALPC
jgi:hypothetical protein